MVQRGTTADGQVAAVGVRDAQLPVPVGPELDEVVVADPPPPGLGVVDAGRQAGELGDAVRQRLGQGAHVDSPGAGAFLDARAAHTVVVSRRARWTSTARAGMHHSQMPNPNSMSSRWKPTTPAHP